MALTRKSTIKVINNTTGSLSFIGVDGRKYLFTKPNTFKMIGLADIENLFNECEIMINDGYIIFEDKSVYDFLGVPEEVYSKLISLDEIPELLEKDENELKEELKDLPAQLQESVARIAKEKRVDSKKKIKAIKETTGFDIEDDDEE